MSFSRSPSEYFIRFLVSRQDADTETIAAILDDHEIVYKNNRYLEQVKSRMDPFPAPFLAAPSKKHKEGHLATKVWLKKKGIHDLWYPTEAVQEAYRILGEPRVRSMLEDLLLSPMRVEEITKHVNKHFGIALTVDGVATFGHYFWNKNLLTPDEWISVLGERKPESSAKVIVQSAPDVANMIVPWVTGLSGPPANINSGTVARRVRDVAFMKLLEIERRPAGDDHSKTMAQYMKVVCLAENEMRQSDVALKDVLSAFEKFRLNKDAKPVPSIEKVAKLNYSQSGAGTDGDPVNRLLEDT